MVLGHALLITMLLLGESAASEIRKMVPCDGWTPMRLSQGTTVRSIFACSSKCQGSPMCSSFQYLGRICRLEDFALPESARVNVTEGCFRSKFVFIFFFNVSVFFTIKIILTQVATKSTLQLLIRQSADTTVTHKQTWVLTLAQLFSFKPYHGLSKML